MIKRTNATTKFPLHYWSRFWVLEFQSIALNISYMRMILDNPTQMKKCFSRYCLRQYYSKSCAIKDSRTTFIKYFITKEKYIHDQDSYPAEYLGILMCHSSWTLWEIFVVFCISLISLRITLFLGHRSTKIRLSVPVWTKTTCGFFEDGSKSARDI